MVKVPINASCLSIGHAHDRSRAAERGRPSGGGFNSMIDGNTQLLCAYDVIERAARYRSIPAALVLEPFGESRRDIVHCAHTQHPTLVEVQHAKLGFADARRILQHCLEHWL